MAKISRIEPKMPALKKRQKVAAYARVSMETDRLAHSGVSWRNCRDQPVGLKIKREWDITSYNRKWKAIKSLISTIGLFLCRNLRYLTVL